MYRIHKKLHLLEVPSPADVRGTGYSKKRGRGEWNRHSVVRILANETYAGTWHWRKTIVHNGQRVSGPEDGQITVKVPAIISPGTWEAAMARRIEHTSRACGGGPAQHLLSRHLVCGRCGARVSARFERREVGPSAYYGCPARDGSRTQYSHVCDLPYFRADQLEPVVWSWAKCLSE